MAFLDRPVLRPLPNDLWDRLNEIRYQGARDLIVIPVGESTDLASVPMSMQWLFPAYGGVMTSCAILHDHLWNLARERERIERYNDGVYTCTTTGAHELLPPDGGFAVCCSDPACPGVELRWTRRDADGVLRRALEEAGMSWLRRWLIWSAVRVGGCMRDATPGDWMRVLGLAPIALVFCWPAVPVAIVRVVFQLAEGRPKVRRAPFRPHTRKIDK